MPMMKAASLFLMDRLSLCLCSVNVRANVALLRYILTTAHKSTQHDGMTVPCVRPPSQEHWKADVNQLIDAGWQWLSITFITSTIAIRFHGVFLFLFATRGTR